MRSCLPLLQDGAASPELAPFGRLGYLCITKVPYPFMISKARIKFVHALAMKKHRDETGYFVAEGPKVVGELLGTFQLIYLAATADWAAAHPQIEVNDLVTPDELRRASFLEAPRQVLAVFARPARSSAFNATYTLQHTLCLALDGVQDPGNLGTIVRLADWFGIHHVFCSPDCADAFAPKVVQATMGALARVQVHYGSLPALLKGVQGEIPVWGTFLDGQNLYQTPLSQNGMIVMGSEGQGIRPELEPFITQRITIPDYAQGHATSESLNVAVATAVVCAEFRRRAQYATHD